MSQKSATIAVINNNKILLLKRGSTAPWNTNKYCLVGGRIDDNESLEDCALREASEEIGITLDRYYLDSILVSYSNYTKKVFLYLHNLNQDINLNYEHSEYVWLSYSECESYRKNNFLVSSLAKVLTKLNRIGLLV
jgi:8-oxo-dGTP pyrophosphatase MutT (NUDIX family)